MEGLAEWNRPHVEGSLSHRKGTTLNIVERECFLWGGRTDEGVSNEMYTLKLDSEKVAWAPRDQQGEIPPARECHTTTVVHENKLLLFGGQQYDETLKVFNDVYIFDVSTNTWEKPEIDGKPPPARARHTAVFSPAKNCLYVFGGYRKTTRRLNDIYELNLDTWVWSQPNTTGAPPSPRYGHAAVLLDNKLMILGGLGGDITNTTLDDSGTLDLDTMEWDEKDHHLPHAAAMLSAVAMDSAGYMKLFIFGGQTGSIMDYTSRVHHLTTNTMEWSETRMQSTGSENEPPPVADCAIVYDPVAKNILAFGGAGNEVMDGLYCLDVRPIVGPEYAMFELNPPLGPLHGGMSCTITGQDFYLGSDIKVQLTDGRRETTVPGSFESPTAIKFITPDLSMFGDKVQELNVRVSMDDDEYTVNLVSMKIFLDTKASNSLAYGPGLLEEGAANMETSFVIWAKNLVGQERTHGGDNFEVKVKRLPPVEEEEAAEEEDPTESKKLLKTLQAQEEAKAQSSKDLLTSRQKKKPQLGIESDEEEDEHLEAEPEEIDDGSVAIDIEVHDHNDGSYEVTYNPDEPGTYEISIVFDGHPIPGSPFQVQIKDELAESQTPAPQNKSNFFPIMTKYVPDRLNNLEEDLRLYESTLAMNVGDRVHTLLKVMSCIEEIQSRRTKVDLELAQLKEVAQYMVKNKAGEDHRKHLNRVSKSWEKVKATAPQVDKDLVAHKNKAKVDVKKKIESFNGKINRFDRGLSKNAYYVYETHIEDAYFEVDSIRTEIASHETALEELEHLAMLFNFTQLLAPSVEKVKEHGIELVHIKNMWDMSDLVEDQLEDWRAVKWTEVQSEIMELRIKEIIKSIRQLDRRVKQTDTFNGILNTAKSFQASVPLVVNLRHPSMRERHWQQLMETTNTHFVIDENFVLADLLALNLPQYEALVDQIVDRALKEEKMEKALAKLKEVWDQVSFTYTDMPDEKVKLVKITEDDFEQLENDQLVVQSMMGSKYLSTFEDEVLGWRKGLIGVERVMTIWGEIQRTWAYLVTLFIGSEEVKRDLPEDSERFAKVDVEVRKYLNSVAQDANALEVCNRDGLYDDMVEWRKALEECEKSLMDYLDSKRVAFPRFYFVSTTDLLDILCNGNNPVKIMVHMNKVILGIADLELNEAQFPPSAVSMTAAVGVENVKFSRPLQLNGKVEHYLQDVIQSMRDSLRDLMGQAVSAYGQKARDQWLLDWPAQLMLTASQVHWTTEVNAALTAAGRGDKSAIQSYSEKQRTQLNQLIEIVTGDLEKPVRQKIMTLITLDTHARDIVDKLIAEEASDVEAFSWTSQLRYRWDPNEKDCFLNICDARFRYGYEYLGNGPRLVITPLTDRIYITATQSLHLRLGCAPAGPAGTGKTETTKDLASSLGKPCYVFNCSDQMDYKGMGNIFKGLAASGSWGCFDEFNRLVPAVLSVCSVQFKAVVDAVRHGAETFTVEGATLKLDPTVGVFITMNPGYLGRAELPETLKTLFRPITVMKPDLGLICENMLMAEGFKDAKILARKFTNLYQLLADLLSKQSHYDWGLRAIKSVLVIAGSFKRAEPEVAEMDLLMRALRDSNLAKIPTDDVPVFQGLISDLFPGVEIPRKRDLDLEGAIEEVCNDPAEWPELDGRCLTPEATFVLKVVQLHELMSIRHCVFAIGGAGSGKSTVWKTLARAQSKVGPQVMIRDLNPKAITPNELYGYVELSTREWKDGLLSNIMRDLSTMPDKDPKWIILDGDLDANWIESMNSVMDDNKILTLASNERIPLLPHMRMIFEIRDLNFATPATVSRAGILYISEGEQWDSYAQSWVNSLNQSDETKENLREFFARYVPGTLTELRLNYKHAVPMTNFNMVYTICNLLDGLFDPANNAMPENPSALTLETYFVFAAVWGFGSALIRKDNVDYRKQFSEWWKFTYKGVKFSPRDSVFDVFVDPETEKFVQWRSVVPECDFDSQNAQMNNITVPIAETTSINYFASKLMSLGHPIMLVGGSGVGKTAVVRGMLKELDESYVYVTTNLNYYSDSALLQRTMEAPLEKKAGRNFGPPGNKKLVYFVDDLNMPVLDPYNTQGPIALLRQHLDYGHWYDRDKLSHKDIKNVGGCQYICAMNPTAGSFVINPRLQRHFAVFALDLPAPGSLMDIYRTFLAGHLAYFEPDVQENLTKIVHAALLLHSKVSEGFKKTAVNFHYEFTMRHLANVFQGLLMADPGQFKGDTAPVKFVELWLHESERVYSDRLVTPNDIIQYKKLAKEVNSKFFASYNLSHLFEEKAQKPLVFAHFAHGTGDKIYDKVPTIPALQKILQECLNEYNEENVQMNLLLFEDAVKHVARISRIIESPAGHALLVGVGGSGKQSLSRLAAYAAGFSVFQITISSNYGMNDLKEDLKSMFMRAGLKNESLMFLLTESQVTQERFLVYINDLLSSADIPGLLNIEDIDNIVNSIRVQVKQAGLDDTRDNCIEFFRDRVRTNLHVVLCFSPVGENFRTRMRRFPALVNCTVIDWFQPWPESALLGVARKFLQEVDLGSDEVRTGIENFMPFSFQVVNDVSDKYRLQERRYNYTTPKSYLELINLYKLMLSKKRDYLHTAIERLETGLAKLHKTSQEVDVLSESLRVKSVEVEEKKLAAEVFAEQVGREKAIVEAETAKANAEEEACAKIQVDVSQQREQCETQLTQAEPLVARAMAALDTLNKKDLGEMKALKSPPTGVDDVLIGVMVLLSKDKKGPPKGKNRTWTNAVNIVGNTTKFIETLKSFKDEITEENVPAANFKEIRPYLKLEYFNRDDMSVKSKAAAGLCEWVINIVKYYDIVCLVNPMRRALAKAETELEEATTKLAEVRAQVAELEEQLGKVLAEFEEADKQKQAMIAEMEASQAKLDLAQRLVSALESENVRWQEGIKELRAEQGVVVGDALLAASFVSYIGGFSKQFRDELLNEHWIPFLRDNHVPLSEKMDPLAILTSDSEVAQWQNQGLPADRVSIENGCIVSNCERWPLIIDPQLQGITWIKEREAENDLQVVRLGQKGMLRTMEMAIQEGKPVLIENLGESIDAVLMGVVGRQITKKLGVEYFTLGDKEVELNRDFRLYLHTKLSSPHYPPEIQAEATLINFAVTQDGLEDQLLAVVVGKERPDLEEQKLALIKQQNDFKIKLKELEDDLLMRLASAEGDLTEDVPLIENLEESKRVATEIGAKVVIANETERKINIAREMYRPAAERGSLLFFLLNDLNRINSFYQFSLKSFIQVFVHGIETADPETKPKGRVKVEKVEKSAGEDDDAPADAIDDEDDDDDDYDPDIPEVTQEEMDAMVQVRLVSLIENTSYSVFSYTRRGLFEKHKLIVATQLTLSILEKRGEIDAEELAYLMIGKVLPVGKPERERLQRFINESAWGALHGLNKLAKFSKIVDEVSKYADLWDKWCADDNPESLPVPKAPGDKSPPRTSFQRLLIVRALRPDRLSQAMSNFVRENLGDRYVEQPPFDVEETYSESNKATPIFFILFPGAQPVKDIEALAASQNMQDRFVHISMGQGQEPVAEKWLDEYGKNGGWVFLDNVHLMQAWLPTLERKLEILSEEGHEDFRCYYSAEPHPNALEKTVPESILKVSIKVVNEPPQDLKANLRRAFAVFDDDKFERSSKATEYKPCLFALCFFHALVLGRRKFGPQGWSRTYSFNLGDLNICADVLHNYISGSDVVPWEDMRYMFGQIMYGGHITDRWDRRTCRTYLAEIFQPTLFKDAEIAPDFTCPPIGDRESFATWIEEKLPRETPAMFGLHANAEIDFLTTQGEFLFRTIIDMKGAGSVGGTNSRESLVLKLIADLLEKLPADFDLAEINERVSEKTPFIVVMLQECTRMNTLLSVIRRSLEELHLGLTGALNITDAMEGLNLSLFVDRVPESWAAVAYPSLKSLGPWFADLLERVKQLKAWSATLETPISVWIAALFNPMAFLTAVMQTTARANNLPLDSMIVLSEITKFQPEDLKKPADKGRYIHGLSLQGCRWDVDEEGLSESLSKELFYKVPVVQITAGLEEDLPTEKVYECPVYITPQRGPTYVTSFMLPTQEASNKWVLAGVALLMAEN